MTPKLVSKYFMLGTLLIWGVFDIFLYIKYGNAATESATTWREGNLFAGLVFFVGALMGHFFGQWRKPSPDTIVPPTWRAIGKTALVVLMTPWCLLDGYGIIVSATPSVVDTFVWSLVGHQVWLLFLIAFGIGSLFLPMDEPTDFPS